MLVILITQHSETGGTNNLHEQSTSEVVQQETNLVWILVLLAPSSWHLKNGVFTDYIKRDYATKLQMMGIPINEHAHTCPINTNTQCLLSKQIHTSQHQHYKKEQKFYCRPFCVRENKVMRDLQKLILEPSKTNLADIQKIIT